MKTKYLLFTFIGLIGVGLVNSAWRLHASESLYGACLSGDESAAKMWLRLGADPDFRFDGTSLPLSATTNRLDFGMSKVLLEAGANPSLTNECKPIYKRVKDMKLRELLERYRSPNTGGTAEDCRK